MAEIPVEKKSSKAWLWVLLALILAALLIWWIASSDDDAEPAVADNSATEMSGTEGGVGATGSTTANAPAAVTLAAILAEPQTHVGRQFSGEVDVAGPLTDRGFWIESDGARMFALIVDEPREVPLDINAGQRLRITDGRIRAGGQVADVEGAALKDNTRTVLADQEVFLIADEKNIEILERP